MARILAAIGLLVMILSGCAKEEEIVPALLEPVSAQIDTAVARRGDVYNLTTYDAKIYPSVQEVSFTASGRVKDYHVYLGKEVKEGDVLITLQDESILKNLETLEQQLQESLAKNEYDLRQLDWDIELAILRVEQKQLAGGTAVELTQLEADMEKLVLRKEQTVETQNYNRKQIENRIRDLKEELEGYQLIAPSDGTVAYINYVTMNTTVGESDIMVVLADHSNLHVQSEYIMPSVIGKASRIYALIGGKEYDAEYIRLTADEVLRMKNGAAGIESRYEVELGPDVQVGDYAAICIQDNLKENVITIPKKSLYREGGGSFVYRLKDGSLEKVNVVTGTESAELVEIIEGLDEGDVVYVQG